MRGAAVASALTAGMLVAAMRSPDSVPAIASDGFAHAMLFFRWWASIVLASLPYVTAGAFAAGLARRIAPRGGLVAMAFAMLAPGCDCAVSGYADAFARGSPAIAGFALAWSAAAGPAALVATRAVLGTHLLLARLAGAAVAAALTAIAWNAERTRWNRSGASACRSRTALVDDDRLDHGLLERVASGIFAVSASALSATALVSSGTHVLHALASPVAAAAAGAILSPCSTADAVLARVLLHDPPAQAAFVIAAQCVDVRQLATIARAVGARFAALAAIAGIAGCATAALVAR